MRYAKNQKVETRQRIIEISSALFRGEGIEKVGISPLMAAANLTVGGFYSHFKSKEELIKEAIEFGHEQATCRLFGKNSEDISIALIVERYLSVRHRDSPETGCVIASLSSDLRNRPEDTRSMASDMIADTVQRIGNCLPQGGDAESRGRIAWSVWAMIIGTLQLARISPDSELSEKILNDGKVSVLMYVESIAKMISVNTSGTG